MSFEAFDWIQRLVNDDGTAVELAELWIERISNGGERGKADFLDFMRKFSALVIAMHRASHTMTLDVLLARTIDIATGAVDADRGALFLNDPMTDELYSYAVKGELTSEIRIPNSAGIAGQVFTSGEPLLIDDAYADDRFNKEIDKESGYHTRTIICAPIRTPQSPEVIGVIQLLNKRGDRPFDAGDLSLLREITTVTASALRNAQMVDFLQRAKEEEELLLEVTTAISQELQLQPLLQLIMDASNRLLDADRSTLFVYDKKTDQLWSQVATGDDTREIRIPASSGIAGSVFRSGETINIRDAYADSRFNQAIDRKTGYHTRSILCMPVRNKHAETIGVFQVLNKLDGPFSVRDEQRLAAFSAQVSIALENAKLFDDVLAMKNYNEAILQSLSNGVVTLDGEGVVSKVNDAASRILRSEPARIEGRRAADIVGARNTWILEHLDRTTESQSAENTPDTELVLPNGDTVAVNLTTVPLADHKKRPIGSMIVLEDITEEKRLRSTMARYMTREIAEKLLESGAESLGGKFHEATVFFSDIRDFTTLSERIGPQATVAMLNDYFTVMVDVVLDNGGILDKFIGDSIMAVFGAPFSSGEDADRAVRSAIEMLRSLREFNDERVAQNLDPVGMKVGVNSDAIISGNIGSPKRMDYTVIGDGVNLAARLEGANKYYGTNILISGFTHAALTASYVQREVDVIRVKGKLQPVAVFEILDYHDEQSFPHRDEVLQIYAEGLELYRGRRFEQACEAFRSALSRNPNDVPSRLHLERSQASIRTPPPAEWDGVWVMTSK
ncbi:MAG: GAF domain-containing protein [Myxococcales bacterium]|nr:GAF domain-containing protein [Myxococcales bacterium]